MRTILLAMSVHAAVLAAHGSMAMQDSTQTKMKTILKKHITG